MPKTFRIGDSVEYDGPEGRVRGTVKKKLTARTKIKGRDIVASDADPQYLVASDDTGEEAAYKPDSLDKIE
jgi:hypothetical protein